MALANLIAWPVAFWGLTRWLQGFVYHVELSLYPIVASGVLALLLALLTIGQQAWRVACSNPVDTLKYE